MAAILQTVLLAAGFAVAQPPAPVEQGTIIVTAPGLSDYRAALAACLARNCPPDEDIDATTALAEALFMTGDYREARSALRASIGRNRDEAARYPEPVSDLFRANARVARHLGLDEEAQSSTREILRSLRAGLPVEDHRHFTARFELVESMVAFSQYEQARRELRELAERARAAGREDIATSAELRSSWVSYRQARNGVVPRELLEWSRSSDPRRSIGARLLLVRIYNDMGNRAEADALMAELGRDSPRRQLLYAPSYQLLVQDQGGAQQYTNGKWSNTDTTIARRAGNMDDQWIDVGFWIQPDGRVADVEIVRRDGTTDWADPLLTSIRGRRYTTLSSGEATYRLERYTYTSGYEARTGSHIRQRSPRARIEYLELGGTPPAGTPAPETGTGTSGPTS